MTTVLKASPRKFVSTPAIERVAARSLRYLQSGYSVHLRGPAGTGKTTLALHLADLLARPIMLLFGDDEFKTSDLIGNQSGYTRKKVVDNFIHSVVKVEDELRQNWVDSRLTLACREGFTMVYDEFNRSRPEVNNVLLSALEEKLLVLPPTSSNRSEYIRVHPQFRAIFTSNPEEYVGIHATQDALLDRLITINIPEPDELSQQEIVIQKTEIDRESAQIIVRTVRAFRHKTGAEKSSGLRSGLMLAKVCHEHGIVATPENADFRDICHDVLLSRAGLPLAQATQLLWEVFNEQILAGIGGSELPIAVQVPGLETDADSVQAEPAASVAEVAVVETLLPESEEGLQVAEVDGSTPVPIVETTSQAGGEPSVEAVAKESEAKESEVEEVEEAIATHNAPLTEPNSLPLAVDADIPALATALNASDAIDLYSQVELGTAAASQETAPLPELPHAQDVYQYLQQYPNARPSEVESALGISRFHAVNAIQALNQKGLVASHNGSSKTHRPRRGK